MADTRESPLKNRLARPACSDFLLGSVSLASDHQSMRNTPFAFTRRLSLLALIGLWGCGGDPLDAAEDVDDIPQDRILSELKKGEAESLCAKQFVLFGGEGGSIQCEGEKKENDLGTFDACVSKLKATKCDHTVKEYRACKEPPKGGSVCNFISPKGCGDLVYDCKLKVDKD